MTELSGQPVGGPEGPPSRPRPSLRLPLQRLRFLQLRQGRFRADALESKTGRPLPEQMKVPGPTIVATKSSHKRRMADLEVEELLDETVIAPVAVDESQLASRCSRIFSSRFLHCNTSRSDLAFLFI